MNMYDVCIVGAGVVGCAIARELMHRRWDTPLRVVVLEQHDGVAEETSGRNSGVLHSGIHEHPCSLKGQLAREGSALGSEERRVGKECSKQCRSRWSPYH